MSKINLDFLGTGAADFSQSELEKNKDCFVKDCRRCASLLINKQILIDCGPHTVNSLKILNADISSITDLFLTHFHSDHFNLSDIKTIASKTKSHLRIHYLKGADMPEVEKSILIPMDAFDSVKISDITVSSMPANHTEFPVHYIIESDNKKIVYATDGAWLLYDTYYFLRNKKIDVYIFDATVGDYNGDYRISEHNSLPMIDMMTESMLNSGIITKDSKLILTHVAKTLTPSFEKYSIVAKNHGYILAYDGMQVQV